MLFTKNKNFSTVKKADKKSSKFYNQIFEWIKTILSAYIIAISFKAIFYENFKIPSGSMNPTLIEGDRLLVSKFYYGYSKYSFPLKIFPIKSRILDKRKPHYGDIVVFKNPKNADHEIYYIKRVAALPGDKIQISNGHISINDKSNLYKYINKIAAKTANNFNPFDVKQYEETNQDNKIYNIYIGNSRSRDENTKTYIVPKNHYFLMGDNRDNSKDSRFADFGTIPAEYIIGRAEIIFFSSSESPLKFWKLFDTIRLDRFFNSLTTKEAITNQNETELAN